MTSTCYIVAMRNSDATTLLVTGHGPNDMASWVDASRKAAERLVPTSTTPGYDLTILAGSWL